MARHAARTALQYALVLFAAICLNFALPRLAPGDAVDYLFPPEQTGAITPEQRTQVLAEFGLDQPVTTQFGRYLAGIARGDPTRAHAPADKEGSDMTVSETDVKQDCGCGCGGEKPQPDSSSVSKGDGSCGCGCGSAGEAPTATTPKGDGSCGCGCGSEPKI